MKEHILNDFDVLISWRDIFTKHLHTYTARICMDTSEHLRSKNKVLGRAPSTHTLISKTSKLNHSLPPKNAGRQSFEIRRAVKGLGGRGPSLEGFCAWLFTVRQEQAACVASQQFHTLSRKSHRTISREDLQESAEQRLRRLESPEAKRQVGTRGTKCFAVP